MPAREPYIQKVKLCTNLKQSCSLFDADVFLSMKPCSTISGRPSTYSDNLIHFASKKLKSAITECAANTWFLRNRDIFPNCRCFCIIIVTNISSGSSGGSKQYQSIMKPIDLLT